MNKYMESLQALSNTAELEKQQKLFMDACIKTIAVNLVVINIEEAIENTEHISKALKDIVEDIIANVPKQKLH